MIGLSLWNVDTEVSSMSHCHYLDRNILLGQPQRRAEVKTDLPDHLCAYWWPETAFPSWANHIVSSKDNSTILLQSIYETKPRESLIPKVITSQRGTDIVLDHVSPGHTVANFCNTKFPLNSVGVLCENITT